MFISTRPCGVLDTNVRRTPHERVEISTRTCGDRPALFFRKLKHLIHFSKSKRHFRKLKSYHTVSASPEFEGSIQISREKVTAIKMWLAEEI